MLVGYCIVHDLCTVFVFESDYKDRRSIGNALPRVINEVFAFPGASFEFECFAAGSERGQNVQELAELAARDAVGQFAGCDSVPEYDLYPDTIGIRPKERTAARELSGEYGTAQDMTQALIDALCAVYGAFDESEIRADASALLDRMTGYYN
ncbi:MAG: hypothetical protein IKO55_03525 [Kiritimatiellae bacterium]|nr:hypothetical protein [Kiritimatiellia bacterium]